MRIARALALIVLAACWMGPARAADSAPRLETGRAYRGVAVLSSSIGRDVSSEEVEAFVRECRIDLVVVDFAWITHHWPRTDTRAVEELAQRLAKSGVVVAAMYRPRLLAPGEAQIHLARGDEGAVAADHDDLCFAWPDSVDWGAAWGEKILAACPSIGHLVLYNVRSPCRCEKCEGGQGAKHAAEFVRTCRERWRKARPGVLVGHVGVGLEFAEDLDFVLPFLPVNREDAAAAVDTGRLTSASIALREKAGAKPFVPLAKVCWESATTNTTEDVAATVSACDARKLGFVLWTYEWLFHGDDGRYDSAALVRALGGDPSRLERFLARPAAAADAPADGQPDGRQWVYFDSRETRSPPLLALIAEGGRETTVPADADSVLISYLADRAWGRMPSLSVSLGDTNRVLLHFPLKDAAKFVRAELRVSVHLSEIPPTAAFEVALHAVDAPWTESETTWQRAPAFSASPAATVTVQPKDAELRIDVTSLAREWASGARPNDGLLVKSAHVVPQGTGPLRRTDPGEACLRRAMDRWTWARSAGEALATAKAAKRPVLALVTASFPGKSVTPHEEILFATALSHPAVTQLVADGFVPVRISDQPWRFTGSEAQTPDPLHELGTNVTDAKAPALVVARADGRHVATLSSIGTFDAVEVLRFLRGALEDAGGPKQATVPDPSAVLASTDRAIAAGGPRAGAARVDRGLALMRLGRFEEAAKALEAAIPDAGGRAGEVSYWLAAVLAKLGDDAKSHDILTRLARGPESDPWATKAGMRLAWPMRVGSHESLVDPGPADARRADAARTASRAIDFLLREQRPDGRWAVAESDCADFEKGATAIAAHALLRWLDDLDAARKERATAALDRADGWLDANVLRGRTDELNSFAAGYFADYVLDRHARSRASNADVATAVHQLEGGLCASGAWSYSKQFGDHWKGGFGGWPQTDRGRAHSVNTGLALVVLARAKEAGFDVDQNAVAAGVAALQAMRTKLGAYTYTWPEPRNFDSEDASVARAPICEQALVRLGKSTKADLRATLDIFAKYRRELHGPVKVTAGWLPPHAYSAYFFHFAYYHAASALADLGDAAARKDLAAMRDDLVAWAEPDGTWVDDLALGKPYGTASALLTLRLAGTTLRR